MTTNSSSSLGSTTGNAGGCDVATGAKAASTGGPAVEGGVPVNDGEDYRDDDDAEIISCAADKRERQRQQQAVADLVAKSSIDGDDAGMCVNALDPDHSIRGRRDSEGNVCQCSCCQQGSRRFIDEAHRMRYIFGEGA